METLWWIECRGPGCGRTFVLCRSCYYGQRYCCQACRLLARKKQVRRAQTTYRSKLKVRLRLAKAARDYRLRVREGRVGPGSTKVVVDQGLLKGPRRGYRLGQEARCESCGRLGVVKKRPHTRRET